MWEAPETAGIIPGTCRQLHLANRVASGSQIGLVLGQPVQLLSKTLDVFAEVDIVSTNPSLHSYGCLAFLIGIAQISIMSNLILTLTVAECRHRLLAIEIVNCPTISPEYIPSGLQ